MRYSEPLHTFSFVSINSTDNITTNSKKNSLFSVENVSFSINEISSPFRISIRMVAPYGNRPIHQITCLNTETFGYTSAASSFFKSASKEPIQFFYISSS